MIKEFLKRFTLGIRLALVDGYIPFPVPRNFPRQSINRYTNWCDVRLIVWKCSQFSK